MIKTTRVTTGHYKAYNTATSTYEKKVRNKLVRVQKSVNDRRRTSSMGSLIKKGEQIIHFSSNRSTGEIFTLSVKDLQRLLFVRNSRKKIQYIPPGT